MGLGDGKPHGYLIARDVEAAKYARLKLKEHNIAAPYIAMHLSDKWLDGGWKIDDLKLFINELTTRSGLPIIATAGGVDIHVSAALVDTLPILRDLTFTQWVAVLDGADLVITPDCGAVHIACALKKPLLAVYPKDRFRIAVAEFGPWETRHYVYSLDQPVEQMPLFLQACKDLLS
jgi:ADP-heptose:LPS heptosyltransferase